MRSHARNICPATSLGKKFHLYYSFKQCLLAAVRRQLRRGPTVAAGSEGVRGGSEGGPRLFTSAVCEETPFTAVRRTREAAVASLGADGVQTGVGAAEP